MNPSYQPNYGSAPMAVAEPVATSNAFTITPYPTNVIQSRSAAETFLTSQGWPSSIQEAFFKNISKIAVRFFICDDSGSMGNEDGKTTLAYQGKVKAVKCSRWKELTNSLRFHMELAHAGGIPTEFRFLNSSSPLRMGFHPGETEQAYQNMKSILDDGSPGGGTPLCRHIREVTQLIQYYEPQLRANGQVVCLIIATDGEASDGDIAEALRPLKALPVWLVLRFCTDEENIVNAWNKIDDDLELNMDVLDDYFGEAKEIHEVNPWLVYGEPLHRFREFGITIKEMDKIDEALLSVDEMTKVCKLCLGAIVETFPHPQVDMKGFIRELKNAILLETKVWNPITEQTSYWIDTEHLKRCYRAKSGGCIIM